MSRSPAAPPIHVSWTPGSVEVVNAATGARASAVALTDLRAFWNGNKNVLVGVGRSLVFLKTARLPKAAPDDLRRILGIQMAQLFPLPPDQLSFDFLQTNDHNGDGYLTLIGAIRSEDLRQLKQELRDAGIQAERILPLSLAAPAAAASAGAHNAIVAAPDPGGLGLDVVQGGIIRFSRLASLDSDVAVEAQRTMAAAQSGALPLVAAGNLTLPSGLTSSSDLLTLLDQAPPFAFELAEERNLEEKTRLAKRMRMATMITVLALLLCLVPFLNRSDDIRAVQRSNASWSRQSKRITAVKDAELDKAQTAIHIQTILKSAFEPAQSMSDVVAYISDQLPAGAWLTGVGVERGKAIQLRGMAKTSGDVTQFVNALGASARFRDVKLVFASTGTIGTVPVVQFNITAVGVGNLPMPVPEKAAVGARKATTTVTKKTTGGSR
jgi:Tfp pilus assembly protein PilN